MRHICAIISNRASYARTKSVLEAIKMRKDLKLSLVVESSALLERYGPLTDVLRRDGFEVASAVYMIIEGSTPSTMARSAGIALLELPSVLESLRPDVVLVVADRFETLPTAMAASYMNIPIAHLLGGEVTGSIDESVRHAVTKLSHLHFAATKKSAERIIAMGERPEFVHHVGCPSIDILMRIDPKFSDEDIGILNREGVGFELDYDKPFLLVLQHPNTTEYGQGLHQIGETLAAVTNMSMQTLMFWPNVDPGSEDIAKGMRIYREVHLGDHVRFMKNLPVEIFVKLLANCSAIAGNSSAAIREGSFLGTPAVNIGTRQNGRERGRNVRDAGYNRDEIKATIEAQVDHGKYESEKIYGDGTAGRKVAQILEETDLSKAVQKMMTY